MAGPIDNLKDFYLYSQEGRTEVERDYKDLWNGASRGGLRLAVRPTGGDLKYANSPKKIDNLVALKEIDKDDALTSKDYAQIQTIEVKCAYGSDPVRISKLAAEWRGLSSAQMGTHWGTQVGVANNLIKQEAILGSIVAAISGNTSQVLDKDGGTTAVAANKMTLEKILEAQSLFQSDYGSIGCIIMHSKAFWDFQLANLASNKELFDYPGLFRTADPKGIPIIAVDSDRLKFTETVDKYRTLFLRPGAVTLFDDGNYTENIDTSNGRTLITSTIQSEGSFNIGIMGYSWKVAAGTSPLQNQLEASANWEKVATSDKDCAGVLLTTQ